MHLYCHEQPEILTLETQIADALPGKVALAQSPFYPGGGGQLADRGSLAWNGGEARVIGFEISAGKLWHLLDTQAELAGPVVPKVDPDFRHRMRQLHTDTHILNALVFQSFDGALVTGVQMADDGTARMDFDLPGADNERLRALEGPINDLIRQDIPLNFVYVPMEEAQAERNAGGAADSSSGPGEAAVEAANEAAILAIAAGVASEAGMTARQCTPLVRALWGWCLFHDLPVEPLRQSPPAGPSTDGEAGPAAPS